MVIMLITLIIIIIIAGIIILIIIVWGNLLPFEQTSVILGSCALTSLASRTNKSFRQQPGAAGSTPGKGNGEGRKGRNGQNSIHIFKCLRTPDHQLPGR